MHIRKGLVHTVPLATIFDCVKMNIKLCLKFESKLDELFTQVKGGVIYGITRLVKDQSNIP